MALVRYEKYSKPVGFVTALPGVAAAGQRSESAVAHAWAGLHHHRLLVKIREERAEFAVVARKDCDVYWINATYNCISNFLCHRRIFFDI